MPSSPPSPRFRADHAALLVVDMQNAFVSPLGSIARLGMSTARNRAIVPSIERLLTAFREARRPVIHTTTCFRADYRDAGLIPVRFPPLQALGHLVTGTWDARIVDELMPRDDDFIVRKSRFNAFYGTNLEIVLRGLGVDTLVVAGVATNVCVDSTVREAFARDLTVFLPRDATASYTEEMEEASLATLRFMFANLTTTSAIIAGLADEADAAESEAPALAGAGRP